jgi:hypothetical protein
MVRKVTLAAILLLVLVASLIAAEMTADDLIAKYFAATGGEQNARALKSMMMKGTMFVQGQSLELKVRYVLPSKSCVEVGMGGIPMQTIATDGKNAWMKHPMAGNVYMSGEDKEDAMRQANLFPLLDYKKAGAKVKFLGEDLVKGAKAYKLEFVYATNDTVVYFFDATTFLAVKEKQSQATVMYSDFRKIGDFTMPYKINVQAQESMMMTFDTIAVNLAVPDSIFIMPKDAKSLDSLKALQQKQGAPGGGGGR